MMRIFIILACVCLVHSSYGQVQELVLEQVENAGRVPGKTYRLYAVMKTDMDKLLVVFGDSISPLYIKSSAPFFQSSLGGATAQQSNRKLKVESDSLRHDSWITIGGEDNYECKINVLNLNLDNFEMKGGTIEIPKDGAWFTLPTDKQAEAGSDKKVLLGQFTTKGEITGQLNVMSKDAMGNSHQQKGLKFKSSKK
jgi:hypothetical protein